MKICIFGDSITEGFYDDEKGGWVNRLKNIFENDEICNCGVSGDTTEELLKRLDADIENKNPAMVVFAIGINDSIMLPREKRNYVDIDKFEKNLNILIRKAKNFTGNIVFIGLTPVDEDLTNPIPWELEMYYTNEEIRKYDNLIQQVCENNKLKFIDMLASFKDGSYKEMLSDGLHPNEKGHKWMAKKIAQELKS